MTQQEALDILKTGANVFLSGEPGSGKSYTINQYVSYLREHQIEPAITASTGIAATHIGGMTIHSWSGIGIKNQLTSHDLATLVDNKRLVARLRKTNVLIIDEVSMLSANTLSTVELACRKLRKSALPFGGIQVVLVGDFFQLPPIVRREEQLSIEGQDIDPDINDDGTPFAFRSPAWRSLELTICYLSEQHRQEDAAFLDSLNALRRGQITDEVRNCFNKRCLTDISSLDDKVTKLFPHNANVDQLNSLELAKLPTDTRSFTMRCYGAPPLIESLKRSCLSPETLTLKVGAKVMFTKNSPEGKFVNGTIGSVSHFSEETNFPVIELKSGRSIEAAPMEWAIQEGDKTLAAISQLPLRLAWAITVHKSQGMSLDAALIDLRSAFEYGQGYVALSRVRTLDGLHLLGFNERALEVHPAVLAQDGHFQSLSRNATTLLKEMPPLKLAKIHKDFLDSCTKEVESVNNDKHIKGSTHLITKDMLLNDKLSLYDIAEKRAMTVGTIISHIEKLVEEGTLVAARDLAMLKPSNKTFEEIKKVLLIVDKKEGQMFLSQTRELLGAKYSFDEIRLTRLFVQQKRPA